MKKIVMVLLLAALVAGGAFAQISMSAGLGGLFSGGFTNYVMTSDGKDIYDDADALDSINIGGGFLAYFDATYAMLTVGMSFYDHSPANADEKKDWADAKRTVTTTFFDIGLYGKFPIDMGGFSLFPILGGEVKIALAQDTNEDGEKTNWSDSSDDAIGDWLTSLWLRVGVGADIPLGDKLYIRPMILYGLGSIAPKAQKAIDDANDDKKLYDVVNHGFDIKVAVGYKF